MTSLSSSPYLKSPTQKTKLPSAHLKSLSASSQISQQQPNQQSPHLQAVSDEYGKPLRVSPSHKPKLVSFKEVHGSGSIPLIPEESPSVKDSSPGSRGHNNRKSNPSFSPRRNDEVAFISRKISLPQLSNRLSQKSLLSPDAVKTEGNENSITPRTEVSAWDVNSSSDYIKQAEFINTSPHFSKFHQLSNVLSKIEAKKSSLSKELFYYPEQIEVHKKLSIQANTILKNRDEDGELGIIQNTRHEVNILEGRNAYFKLHCQNKMFPLKVRLDLFLGSFEVRVSKTKKKPEMGFYDHLFTVSNFDINYENPEKIKYLYFGIHALERLRVNLSVSFTLKPKVKLSLSPLPFDMEKMRRKHKAYEFFSKEMRPEEVENLRQVAEAIREEKQQKALQLTHNINLVQVNQLLASKYDKFREEQLHSFVTKRENRYKMNQQNRDTFNLERQKKFLCESYRNDIRKIRHQWEDEEHERIKTGQEMAKIFSAVIAFFRVIKELAEKKVAFRVIKMIKKSIELKVIGIQRTFRNYINRELTLREPRMGMAQMGPVEARNTICIYKALNAWALNRKRIVAKKVPQALNKFFEDMEAPLGILDALDKYNRKVVLVKDKWKKRKQVYGAKLEMFIMYWEKYCKSLIDQEKNKTKRQQTTFLLSQISDDHVKKHGRDFLRAKTKAIIKATSVFITMQSPKLHSKGSKGGSKGHADEKKDQSNSKTNSIVPHAAKGSQADVEVHEEPDKSDAPDFSSMVNAKPTTDELKRIFDKILSELKQEHKI